jgi:hypothetical protein
MSASELTRDLTTGIVHWRELDGDRLIIDDGCDAKQEDPFDFPSAADPERGRPHGHAGREVLHELHRADARGRV